MKHPDELFDDVSITPNTEPEIDVDPNPNHDPDPKLHENENEDDDIALKFNDEYDVSEEDKSASVSPPSINISSAEFLSKMESVKGALGRWSRMVGEATRKAEDLAENTWQHLKTGPSFADAALGRIAQGTKVLAEGGYEKIFQQTFETVPEERLQDAFACYMSTSVGPVMGVLYVSTEKLAYCSDNPLSYEDSGTTEWSYYKVTIPLCHLKAIKPSLSSSNSSEKYIQVISVDNREYWFMGFLNYSVAENLLKEVLEVRSLQPA